MATFGEHFDRIRTKPHQERRRIAFTLSLLITGVIALGWVGAMATSDVFVIKPRALADGTLPGNLSQTKTQFSSMLGAAGAAVGATTSPARITVVDGAVYSSLDAGPENHNNTTESVITF